MLSFEKAPIPLLLLQIVTFQILRQHKHRYFGFASARKCAEQLVTDELLNKE